MRSDSVVIARETPRGVLVSERERPDLARRVRVVAREQGHRAPRERESEDLLGGGRRIRVGELLHRDGGEVELRDETVDLLHRRARASHAVDDEEEADSALIPELRALAEVRERRLGCAEVRSDAIDDADAPEVPFQTYGFEERRAQQSGVDAGRLDVDAPLRTVSRLHERSCEEIAVLALPAPEDIEDVRSVRSALRR